MGCIAKQEIGLAHFEASMKEFLKANMLSCPVVDIQCVRLLEMTVDGARDTDMGRSLSHANTATNLVLLISKVTMGVLLTTTPRAIVFPLNILLACQFMYFETFHGTHQARVYTPCCQCPKKASESYEVLCYATFDEDLPACTYDIKAVMNEKLRTKIIALRQRRAHLMRPSFSGRLAGIFGCATFRILA